MAWVMVAVTGSKMLGQITEGNTAEAMANNQALALSYQADAERTAAERTATLIRRAGRRQAGAANAAFAGAGVKVGQGSAATVEAEIIRGSESDAFQAILEGKRRGNSLDTEAQMTRISGDMARQAGYVGAVNSALDAYGNWSRASGWNKKSRG